MSEVCDDILGVDIYDNRKNKSTKFIQSSTDNFFINNNKTFDLIFIDADHNYNSVKKDFNNSLNILNKNGTIILHDTDPESEYLKDQIYCGDAYKIINDFKNNSSLQFVTLPIFEPGITIVRRATDIRA